VYNLECVVYFRFSSGFLSAVVVVVDVLQFVVVVAVDVGVVDIALIISALAGAPVPLRSPP